MAELKVVDPTQNGKADGPDVARTFNEYDANAADKERDMYDMQDRLAKKKYRVKTTETTLNYLMNDFFNNVAWSGYECYAISETNKELTKLVDKLNTKEHKNEKRSFTLKVELLEALFHFVKQHAGTGLEAATNHRLLCEDLSVPMSDLNKDRGELRELALEAEAAKHGITVEEYKKAADAMHAAPKGAPQPNLR